MKFLEYGIQDNTWAAKHYQPEDGSTKVELRPVEERYLRVYMPWKRKIYCINDDQPHISQPCWHVYWHGNGGLGGVRFARWGWQ